MTPFFSIIIPCLNSSVTINRALDSVLNQSFKDFEILIIDGASQDDTVLKIKEFKDDRIKISVEKDFGIYDAMNKGLNKSTGTWLYFLGSDDKLFDPFVLNDIHEYASSCKCDVLYGNVKVHGDTPWAKDGTVYSGKFDFYKFFKSNICHQSIFYKRDFISKNQLFFDLKFPMSSDWDFNFRCWDKTKFQYIERVVAVFYSGGFSSVNSNDPFLLERKKYLTLNRRIKEYFRRKIYSRFNLS